MQVSTYFSNSFLKEHSFTIEGLPKDIKDLQKDQKNFIKNIFVSLHVDFELYKKPEAYFCQTWIEKSFFLISKKLYAYFYHDQAINITLALLINEYATTKVKKPDQAPVEISPIREEEVKQAEILSIKKEGKLEVEIEEKEKSEIEIEKIDHHPVGNLAPLSPEKEIPTKNVASVRFEEFLDITKMPTSFLNQAVEVQKLKDPHPFMVEGTFWYVCASCNTFYQNVMQPLLKGAAFICTSTSEEAHQLLKKWNEFLTETHEIWIRSGSQKKINDNIYPLEARDLLENFEFIRLILTGLAASEVNLKNLFKACCSLPIPDRLNLNFEAIEEEGKKVINAYLNDPNQPYDLSKFFNSDPAIAQWPIQMQMIVIFLSSFDTQEQLNDLQNVEERQKHLKVLEEISSEFSNGIFTKIFNFMTTTNPIIKPIASAILKWLKEGSWVNALEKLGFSYTPEESFLKETNKNVQKNPKLPENTKAAFSDSLNFSKTKERKAFWHARHQCQTNFLATLLNCLITKHEKKEIDLRPIIDVLSQSKKVIKADIGFLKALNTNKSVESKRKKLQNQEASLTLTYLKFMKSLAPQLGENQNWSQLVDIFDKVLVDVRKHPPKSLIEENFLGWLQKVVLVHFTTSL